MVHSLDGPGARDCCPLSRWTYRVVWGEQVKFRFLYILTTKGQTSQLIEDSDVDNARERSLELLNSSDNCEKVEVYGKLGAQQQVTETRWTT